jgi:hypothetical protein
MPRNVSALIYVKRSRTDLTAMMKHLEAEPNGLPYGTGIDDLGREE